MFHLETNSNCGLEGIQNGTKHSSDPVRPSTTLEKAVRVLERNSNIKAIDRSISVCERANSTKLWSSTSTSAFVTEVAESMINQEWMSRNQYKCVLVAPRTWYVTHKENNWYPEDDDEDNDDDGSENEDSIVPSSEKAFHGLIPKFARKYCVTITNEDVMMCTCKNQERMGFPCSHIACVLDAHECFSGLCEGGFPLSSISIMWHSSYYSFGISNDPDHLPIQETYKAMQANDTPGVIVSPGIILPSPDPSSTLDGCHALRAGERVRNYPTEHVQRCLEAVIDNTQYPQFAGIVPAGLTQQSNINARSYSQDSDDDHFTLREDPEYEMRLNNDPDDAHMFDSQDSFSKFKSVFRDACNAIDCLDNKVHLHQRMKEFFNSVYHDALAQSRSERGETEAPSGKKVPMLPPISKKQKTHGTNHY